MVDPKIKKRAIHRAKIINGQLGGLIKAIEKEVYCTELLSQSLSIQRSLRSLNALMLENHIKTHAKYQLQKKGEEEKAIQELLRVFLLSNR